jgi:oligopeptide/dipeptide ABC transporter ATP-binding protein
MQMNKSTQERNLPKKTPLLTVDGLYVHFQAPGFRGSGKLPYIRAVDGVSFSIGTGESLGMAGESGCGKSTIARVLLGLHKPTRGDITISGERIDPDGDAARLQQTAQMVFQDPYASLNPRLKIWTQVSEPLRGHRNITSRKILRQAAAGALQEVGLTTMDLEKYPHQFSGGQRQRIAIARALILRPRLLVADEPMSSLDVTTQAEIEQLLAGIATGNGMSLLLISHDLAGICALTQRILVIYNGKIMEEGDTEEIVNAPLHPYTLALIEAVPSISKTSKKRTILPEQTSGIINGCVFHPRCPRIMDHCKRHSPPLIRVGSCHGVACFLYAQEVNG